MNPPMAFVDPFYSTGLRDNGEGFLCRFGKELLLIGCPCLVHCAAP